MISTALWCAWRGEARIEVDVGVGDVHPHDAIRPDHLMLVPRLGGSKSGHRSAGIPFQWRYREVRQGMPHLQRLSSKRSQTRTLGHVRSGGIRGSLVFVIVVAFPLFFLGGGGDWCFCVEYRSRLRSISVQIYNAFTTTLHVFPLAFSMPRVS